VRTARARTGEVKSPTRPSGRHPGNPFCWCWVWGQMLYWPDDFCAALADVGFAVTRFHNRDTGLSTRFSTAGVPSLFMMCRRDQWLVWHRVPPDSDAGPPDTDDRRGGCGAEPAQVIKE
jgi:hypothetical protein